MKIKMKLGCVADSLTVDGVEEKDMTILQKKEIYQRLVDYLAEYGSIDDLNELLQFVVRCHGDYEYDTKPCECCGDLVERYELEI